MLVVLGISASECPVVSAIKYERTSMINLHTHTHTPGYHPRLRTWNVGLRNTTNSISNTTSKSLLTASWVMGRAAQSSRGIERRIGIVSSGSPSSNQLPLIVLALLPRRCHFDRVDSVAQVTAFVFLWVTSDSTIGHFANMSADSVARSRSHRGHRVRPCADMCSSDTSSADTVERTLRRIAWMRRCGGGSPGEMHVVGSETNSGSASEMIVESSPSAVTRTLESGYMEAPSTPRSVRDYLEATPMLGVELDEVHFGTTPVARCILASLNEVADDAIEMVTDKTIAAVAGTVECTDVVTASSALQCCELRPIPSVYIAVPHLLQILPPECLGTFQCIWQETAWWTHIARYRSATPHAVVTNIFKFMDYAEVRRVMSLCKLCNTYDRTMEAWATSASRSAARNEDAGHVGGDRLLPAMCCGCAECWEEHYDSCSDRHSHNGWHPLRMFWLDCEPEEEDENPDEDIMGSDTADEFYEAGLQPPLTVAQYKRAIMRTM